MRHELKDVVVVEEQIKIYKPLDAINVSVALSEQGLNHDCAIDVSACRMPSLDLAVDNILFPALDGIVTTFYLMYMLRFDKNAQEEELWNVKLDVVLDR